MYHLGGTTIPVGTLGVFFCEWKLGKEFPVIIPIVMY